MATETEKFKLTKPEAEDFYDISILNGNMDKIENALKENEIRANQTETLKDNFCSFMDKTNKAVEQEEYNLMVLALELETMKQGEITGTADNILIETFQKSVDAEKGYYSAEGRYVYA